jgi:hypothetical protein
VSLTPPERETVITFSDADNVAMVHTHQRKIITKLERNPAAEKVEDISFDGTVGAVFELPADLISFRSSRRTGRKLTEEQKQVAAANFAKARESASADV